jgi:DNA-binding winged helix-turn-helix (wHTH) protein
MLSDSIAIAQVQIRSTVMLGRAFDIGEHVVHFAANRVETGMRSVRISPLAMDVLIYLVAQSGGCATHAGLLRALWRGSLTSTNAVHKCIAELRRAFGDDPRAPSYIETIPKRGYRLIAPVRRLEERHQPIEALTLESLPRPLRCEFKHASIK